jgi:transposase InsO family protein
MPWQERTPVSLRSQFIDDLLSGEESFAALCRRHGISRQCGYKWKARFEEAGKPGLESRSKAPRSHPNETPDQVVEALLELRRQHPTWGPRKVIAKLERTAPELAVPCASTVGDILKRHGMVAPRRRRPRPPRYRDDLTTGNHPNDVWCADFKGQFPVRSGRMCWPLTVSDLHSRYLLRCQALPTSRWNLVMPVFLSAFHEYGLPKVIRTDNGVPFSTRSPGGLSTLSIWWIKLGIRPERIEPGHPEQNGTHERMHRTMGEAIRPPQATITAQQRRFGVFRREFNEERPHEALQMATPAEIYEPSSRPYPRRIPKPQYATDQVVRRAWRGRATLRGVYVFCGHNLDEELVAFRQVEEHRWEVRFYEHLLGHVDITKPMTGWALRPE